MDWMRSKDNPYFAQAFVNRVWANYFGKGIINPPDDMNLANPPGNARAARLPGRRVHRPRVRHEVAASRDRPEPDLPAELEDERRRTSSTSGTSAGRSSAACPPRCCSTPSPWRRPGRPTWPGPRRPPGSRTRAIGPKGGAGSPAATAERLRRRIFGRSPRDTNCDCAASNEPNLLQSIYLQNDQETARRDRPPRRAGSTSAPAIRPRRPRRPAPPPRRPSPRSSARSPTSTARPRPATWPASDRACKDIELAARETAPNLAVQKSKLDSLPKVDAPLPSSPTTSSARPSSAP